MKQYKFTIGDKVRICSKKNSSVGCKENNGKIVTIKNLCNSIHAYELVELDNLWLEDCFEPV